MILTHHLRPLGLILAASGALLISAHAGSGADDFNRPDSTNPGPNWNVVPGSAISIVGERAQSTADARRDQTMLWASAAQQDVVLQVDVFNAVAGIKFVALTSRYTNDSSQLFVKVQDNNGDGTYDRAFFYQQTSGLSFRPFADLTPFTSARIRTVTKGNLLRLEIDTNFDGTPEQVIEAPGLPAMTGTSVGLGFHGAAKADNFTFSQVPPSFVASARYTVGEDVPFAGGDARIQLGAKWSGFGTPAVNFHSDFAFLGKWKAPSAKTPVVLKAQSGVGIFVNDQLIVKVGDPVPGIPDAIFKSFKDPVMNDLGQVAFIAGIKGSTTATVIPTTSDTVVATTGRTGALEVLAREGSEAPGTNGATYKTLSSVTIQGSEVIGTFGPRQVIPKPNPSVSTVLFTATLNPGTGIPGTTTATDAGAWMLGSGSGTVEKVIREGDHVDDSTVRSFNLLKVVSGSPGVARGLIAPATCLFQLSLATPAGARTTLATVENGIFTPLFQVGGSVPAELLPAGTTAKWTRLGVPSQNESGEFTFSGNYKPDGASAVQAITRSSLGSSVAETTGATLGSHPAGSPFTFASFKDPVSSPTGSDFAFPASVGNGPSGPKKAGIFYQAESSSTAAVIAIAGEPAPVSAEGARWKSFSSLAVTGGEAGTLFTASLQKGLGALPGPGGITSVDDFGLFAYLPISGDVLELVRENQPLLGKLVKSFSVLKAASGSSGSTRAFNSHQVTLLVTFLDKSISIVSIDFAPPMAD